MSGYLAVLETVKPTHKPLMTKHLEELMADAELYGWESVRAYHAVWLQQIENGMVNWMMAMLNLNLTVHWSGIMLTPLLWQSKRLQQLPGRIWPRRQGPPLSQLVYTCLCSLQQGGLL